MAELDSPMSITSDSVTEDATESSVMVSLQDQLRRLLLTHHQPTLINELIHYQQQQGDDTNVLRCLLLAAMEANASPRVILHAIHQANLSKEQLLSVLRSLPSYHTL